MSKNKLFELFSELEESNAETVDLTKKHLFQKRESKKREMEAKLFTRAQEISREFHFTYKAARFEEAWLLDSLVEFAEQEWISDVLRKVKGGKEASVYLCKAGAEIPSAEWVAAKVYRPRMLRNLRNDGVYRAGRADLDVRGNEVVDQRKLRAMRKKTEYGRELLHQSWIAYEFTTLEMLHKAGADVPEPYTMANNAILMEFFGDGETSAPTLSEVDLEFAEAKSLFERVMRNIDILLSHDRVHGDLSAYNVLYWDGDITLIDFPQVLIPESNPASWNIFLRDVSRICQYFSTQGVQCNGFSLATDLWTSHGHSAFKVDPKYLDAENSEDRRTWEVQE